MNWGWIGVGAVHRVSAGPYSETTLHHLHLLLQPTTPERKSLVCLVQSSGQLVPEQLHGCGVAGKEPVPGKPRRGYCICSAVDPLAPTSLPSRPPPVPRTSSAENSRRDSWPVLPGREEDVFMFVCVLHGVGGRPSSNDITAKVMHLNTCTHTYTAVILFVSCSGITTSRLSTCIVFWQIV